MQQTLILILLILGTITCAYSQPENQATKKTLSPDSLMGLTLQDLLKVKIYAASKKKEDDFDTPFSATVITQEEILNSGATTIPEALRLAPGVIVREQTNGIYDIQIRGMDYVPPATDLIQASNNATLVMIDNRIVFRDFGGGTFWESLPIDINDVEKIEIVRGPVTALYGPNAAYGVINIITNRNSQEGFDAYANTQAGKNNSFISNLSLTYGFKKVKIGVSGNYQKRNRYSDKYWDYTREDYVVIDSVISAFRGTPAYDAEDIEERYPDQKNAMDRYGINAYANYRPGEKVAIDLSLGHQNSTVQKIYTDIENTPFTTEASQSQYVNLKGQINHLDVQLSHEFGTQNTKGLEGWELDFNNTNFNMEYEARLLKDKLSMRPGFMYRSVNYDDSKSVEKYGNGFFNGSRLLTSSGAFVKLDYTPSEKTRIVGALRGERYNLPDDLYLSYYLGATHKLNENHLVRLLTSRANKGPNFVDTYMDYAAFGGAFNFAGNRALNLTTTNLAEVGYRAIVNKNIQLDAEVFYTRTENFALMAQDSTVFFPEFAIYSSVDNIDLVSSQTGGTFKVIYIPKKNVKIIPHITVQQTNLQDYDQNLQSHEADTLVDIKHVWTPGFYGGVYFNMVLKEKFNINLNPIFTGKQEFLYKDDHRDVIDPKLLLNISASYNIINQLEFTVSARNLFASDQRQFAFGDPISASFFFGLRINL